MINLGIIGLGWWGAEAHVPALQAHARARVLAVQKRDLTSARKAARDFGIAHAFATVDELLDLPGLDGVIISSTPNVHFEQARAALQRGLHVLIEKPMTFTKAEAVELVALAAARRVQFLISCPWHYTAHGRTAQARVRSGALGRPQLVSVFMTNFTLGFYAGKAWNEALDLNNLVDAASRPYCEPNQNSYSDARVSGGGHIYTQMSHVFAYLGFLSDWQPAELFAQFRQEDTSVDAFNAVQIRFTNGAVAAIASGGVSTALRRDFEVRIVGSEGHLALDLWHGKYTFCRADGTVEALPDLPAEEIYPKFAPARNFVDCILGREPNLSPATLGLYAMNLIEASCQSARSKLPVAL